MSGFIFVLALALAFTLAYTSPGKPLSNPIRQSIQQRDSQPNKQATNQASVAVLARTTTARYCLRGPSPRPSPSPEMGAAQSISTEASEALKQLKLNNELLKCILDKVTVAELRQCSEFGTGNDAWRSLDGWARGNAASISRLHVDEVARHVREAGEWPTYRNTFSAKDNNTIHMNSKRALNHNMIHNYSHRNINFIKV